MARYFVQVIGQAVLIWAGIILALHIGIYLIIGLGGLY